MRNLILILLLTTSSLLVGQNLVPNPSFEEFDTCSFFGSGGIDSATGWWDIGSVDLYNTCQTHSWSSVPTNTQGYQHPYHGNGYAAFVSYWRQHSPYTYSLREYAQTSLTSPLQSGVRYFVSFRVSFFDDIPPQNKWCASDEIGAFFSIDTLTLYDPAGLGMGVIDSVPQIKSPPGIPLSDRQNWTEVSGSFVAKGGEAFISIGNFTQDTLLSLQCGNLPSLGGTGYHYLDAVCVSTDSLTCFNFSVGIDQEVIEDQITIYPNPTTGKLTITLEEANTTSVTIRNSLGQLMLSKKQQSSDKIELDISAYPTGIYFLQLEVDGKKLTKKIIKE